MKLKKAVIFIAATISASSQAQVVKPLNYDFIAPLVYDASTISGPQAGLIIFDTNDNTFKGRAANSASWQILSPVTANVSIGTCTDSTSCNALMVGDIIVANATANSFSMTLPAANASGGKVLEIKKSDSSYNTVTILAAGSDDIDGSASKVVRMPKESIKLISDGSNWQILNWSRTTPWTSYSLTIGATVTAPGTGTVSVNEATWRRVGDSIQVRYNFRKTAGGSAGSGIYLFPLPNSWTVDSSKLTPSTTSRLAVVGSASGGSNLSVGFVKAYDSSNFVVVLGNDSVTPTEMGSAHHNMGNADVAVSFEATVPVTGWE